MGRIYTAHVNIAALTSAKTLIHIGTPSDLVIEILGCSISNKDKDSNEQLDGGMYHVTTNGSPAGTSLAAADVAKDNQGDANTTCTILTNLTTEPTTYETNGFYHTGFSNLGGLHFQWDIGFGPIIPPSAFAGLRLLEAPGSQEVIGVLRYRELG